MKTTIMEIKKLPVGTELKGFPLLIKTARAAFQDGDQKTWQEVVFMDASGEMLGHIFLPTVKNHDRRTGGYQAWKSKTNLCIMQATVQTTEDHNRQDVKLIVTDCFDTATPLTYDQHEELTAEDWQRLHDEEIDSKIRCLLTVEWIGTAKRLTVSDAEREAIRGLVQFVRKG